MIIYRILSFFVTVICSFLAMVTLFGVFIALANPAFLLQCFLMAGVVLYGWFSNRFIAYVLIGKRKMSKKQKDWLQVNAIVAFIFSAMGFIGCLTIIASPEEMDNLIKQLPAQATVSAADIIKVAWVLLAVCSVLLVHISWTYLLIRKHAAYFEA